MTTKRAKLFRNGQSQAVRLPKEFRFEGSEVAISRHGRGVILEPVPSDFRELLASLDEFSEDFFAEGRCQPQPQGRDGLDS